MIQTAQTVPNIGQRLQILVGLALFAQCNLPDDGFCNDGLWRLTPQAVWETALQCLRGPLELDTTDAEGDFPPLQPNSHTGGVRQGPNQRSPTVQITMNWSARNKQNDAKRLMGIHWANLAINVRRESIPAGPGGSIGMTQVKGTDSYPGSSALSGVNSSGDEDYAANFTWVGPQRPAYSLTTGNLRQMENFENDVNLCTRINLYGFRKNISELIYTVSISSLISMNSLA